MSYSLLEDTTFSYLLLGDSPLYVLPEDSLQIDTALLLQPSNSSEQIWGVNSSISESILPSGIIHKMDIAIESGQTLIMMVMVICFYCYIIYRFRRDMISCLKNIGNMEDTLNMMNDQAADFVYFLRSSIILAILSIASLIAVWLKIKIPNIESYYLFLGIIIISVLIIIYRWLVFLLMRWMTDDKESFLQITFINMVNITFIGLIYTPLAIIIGVSGSFFNIGIVILSGLMLYYFLCIYKYFKSRSFSKLQLILYLCTVEILPISFIIALVVRQSGIN